MPFRRRVKALDCVREVASSVVRNLGGVELCLKCEACSLVEGGVEAVILPVAHARGCEFDMGVPDTVEDHLVRLMLGVGEIGNHLAAVCRVRGLKRSIKEVESSERGVRADGSLSRKLDDQPGGWLIS